MESGSDAPELALLIQRLVHGLRGTGIAVSKLVVLQEQALELFRQFYKKPHERIAEAL